MVGMSREYIVEKFISSCERLYSEDYLPYRYSARDVVPHDFRDYFSDEILSDSGKDWVANIVCLTSTPRALKHVLRLCLSSWKSLHGEISLKHLVIAHTLQVCAPEAFQFVFEHIGDLRSIGRKGYENAPEKKRDKLKDKFLGFISDSDWSVSAAEFLVSELFPGWGNPGSGKNGDIQGFQSSSPVDYWERFLFCGLKEGGVTDQSVFKIHSNLLDYIDRRNESESSLDLMVRDKDVSDRYEAIVAGGLDDSVSLSIFEEVIRYVIDCKLSLFSAHDIACFIPLWRAQIYGDKNLDDHVYDDRIFKLVSRAILYNFRLANEIYYYWRSRSSDDRGVEVSWRSDLIEFVKDEYSSNPSSFSSLLDPNFPYSCYHFSVLFSEHKYGGKGFFLDEWRWFFELILRAAEISPSVVVPHISIFLVERANRFDSKIEYVAIDGGVDKYWPDDRNRLRKILSLGLATEEYSEEVVAMVSAAREKIAW